MRLLTEDEFKSTMRGEAEQITEGAAPPFNYWPYFDLIPTQHFEGYECSRKDVDWVYRDADGRFEHVLVSSDHRNVFMVIVVDLSRWGVYGHHLLNLNELYGVEQ